MQISESPLKFKHVLKITATDGSNKDGPVVRYQVVDKTLLKERAGVYLIVQDGQIVYCGKFTRTFAKRWLYTKGQYIFHFKRGLLSAALLENRTIDVYSEGEEALRIQLGQPGNEWISATSIEEKIIRDAAPIWNSIGHI